MKGFAPLRALLSNFASEANLLRGRFETWLSDVHLIQQGLGLLQIERVEAFGEPAVDRSEKIVGLLPFSLIAPKPRHAHRRAQFPGLCLLRTRNRERPLEIRFRFRRISLGRLERDFAGDAIDLGLATTFPWLFPPPSSLRQCSAKRHRIGRGPHMPSPNMIDTAAPHSVAPVDRQRGECRR